MLKVGGYMVERRKDWVIIRRRVGFTVCITGQHPSVCAISPQGSFGGRLWIVTCEISVFPKPLLSPCPKQPAHLFYLLFHKL